MAQVLRSRCTLFQSSPARGGGCNQFARVQHPFVIAVSILTRPWGRVQRRSASVRRRTTSRFNPHPPVVAGATVSSCPSTGTLVPHTVSILTRPWGRVQPMATADGSLSHPMFQSSPARGGGCNAATSASVTRGSRFQSSPARGGGCNLRKYLQAYDRVLSFNPHPPVGAGATRQMPACWSIRRCFNPHPPVGAGATH